MNNETKEKIVEGLKRSRDNFEGSDNKFAVSIGINAAQYSRIKKGERDRILSDEKWITLARRVGVNLTDNKNWRTANTPVFQFVTSQLELCQREGLSTLLCDLSDIGKTYSAIWYKENNKNVVYIDCSQIKQKQKLIRKIAKEFGVNDTGKYSDVYEDLAFYIKTIQKPLIILDEAGDLNYDAFLEIKALWNATEGCCGYYMMGADGLKEKMKRSINTKKVGYTELFSRFGKKYVNVVPIGKEDTEKMLKVNAAMIIKANAGKEADINKIMRATIGEDGLPSLRRIYKAIAIEKR